MTRSQLKADGPLVTIIGAGPAGLLLARYLQINNVSCVIYERETSREARGQGGSLDLHYDTGLLALKETGLLDKAQKMMRPEGDVMKIIGKDGVVWYDDNKPPGGENEWNWVWVKQLLTPEAEQRPEIDRTDLRNLLLDSLDPDTIQWGHGIKLCSTLDNDTYEVNFLEDSHSSVITSILVGADGGWSRVRPLLHQNQPFYTGLSMYDISVPAGAMTGRFQRFVGMGTSFMLGDAKAFIPQMNSGGKCRIYAGFNCDENWLDEHPLPEKGKKDWIVKNWYSDWAAEVKEMIRACDEDSITPRKIMSFDPKMRWKSDFTGVTVIGDAAHLMSPFAGEGVNQALRDALDLGKVIVKAKSSSNAGSIDRQKLAKSLRSFEKIMMSRAAEFSQGALDNQKSMFGPGQPRKWRNMFYMMFALGMAANIAKNIVLAPVNLVRWALRW